MTPEKRLDQLEPIIGEVVAQLDLHTAQLRRANNGIVTLIETTARQSDDIAFLLRGQAEQRDQIAQLTAGLGEVTAGLGEVTVGLGEVTVGLGELNAKVDKYQAETNTRLDSFQQVLTAILNAVQRPSGN